MTPPPQLTQVPNWDLRGKVPSNGEPNPPTDPNELTHGASGNYRPWVTWGEMVAGVCSCGIPPRKELRQKRPRGGCGGIFEPKLFNARHMDGRGLVRIFLSHKGYMKLTVLMGYFYKYMLNLCIHLTPKKHSRLFVFE